jgi:hypothetical protein
LTSQRCWLTHEDVTQAFFCLLPDDSGVEGNFYLVRP